MPTYEYLCQRCGHRFEQRQPITAAPLAECPNCSGKLQRLPGGGAAILVRGARTPRNVPCERDSPCCGREERCSEPPCDSAR